MDICFLGKVYELDGLQSGPILLGESKREDWLETAFPAIQKRIQTYSQQEIRFNLLAIVKNQKQVRAHTCVDNCVLCVCTLVYAHRLEVLCTYEHAQYIDLYTRACFYLYIHMCTRVRT